MAKSRQNVSEKKAYLVLTIISNFIMWRLTTYLKYDMLL